MRRRHERSGIILLIAGIVVFATQPAAAQIFADGFDGESLSQAWEVVNPDQSAYKVEDGNLVLQAGHVVTDADIGAGAMPNLFAADTELPPGDWTMSIRFSVDFKTVRESLVFGLMGGADRYVLADIHTDGDGNRGWQLKAGISKRSGASRSRFSDKLAELLCNVCGKQRAFDRFAATLAMPIDAEIIKSGREYTLRVRQGSENGAWRRIATVVSINPPVRPVLTVRQRAETEGETTFRIDHFRIEANR